MRANSNGRSQRVGQLGATVAGAVVLAALMACGDSPTGAAPSFGVNDQTVGIQAIPTCNGLTATIYPGMPNQSLYFTLQLNGRWKITGTNGDDVMVGTVTGDDMRGEGGNDTMCGIDGDDNMHGGTGDDWMHGGNGPDILEGSYGNDRLEGSLGNDVVAGNAGDDEVYGGQNNDIVLGGPGRDLSGGGLGTDSCKDPQGGTYQGCEIFP